MFQSTGSVVVAQELCSQAWGIFLDQGSNSSPLFWQVDSCPLCHQGSPLILDIDNLCLLSFFLLFKYAVWPNPKSIDPKGKREANTSQGRSAVFLMACRVACLLVLSHSRRVNLLDFLTPWASAFLGALLQSSSNLPRGEGGTHQGNHPTAGSSPTQASTQSRASMWTAPWPLQENGNSTR